MLVPRTLSGVVRQLPFEFVQSIYYSLSNRQEFSLLQSPPDTLYTSWGTVVDLGVVYNQG